MLLCIIHRDENLLSTIQHTLSRPVCNQSHDGDAYHVGLLPPAFREKDTARRFHVHVNMVKSHRVGDAWQTLKTRLKRTGSSG